MRCIAVERVWHEAAVGARAARAGPVCPMVLRLARRGAAAAMEERSSFLSYPPAIRWMRAGRRASMARMVASGTVDFESS